MLALDEFVDDLRSIGGRDLTESQGQTRREEFAENPRAEAPSVRDVVQAPNQRGVPFVGPVVRAKVSKGCDDCRAQEAFQAWHSKNLVPAFNVAIDFSDWGIPPAGTRAVIELVTASVFVPHGERARLRLFTSLDQVPSNLDLTLSPQGQQADGRDVLVGTHAIRAYSDNLIQFNVNRDNPQTEGEALICISGYLVDV